MRSATYLRCVGLGLVAKAENNNELSPGVAQLRDNVRYCQSVSFFVALLILLPVCHGVELESEGSIVPIVADGETQVVPEFKDPNLWVRHDLWVETEFDSDGDGKPDRMHVDVTRPRQTDTTGLKLPVIYISSPPFGGTGAKGREYFWDVRHELGATPPKRKHFPAVKRRETRPIISKSHVKEWVPHGYAVVHSSSPGTGFSQGCPTIGDDNESLAPKAVIDWLNGRAPGYTSPDGEETVVAYWSTGKVGMTGTSHPGTLALAEWTNHRLIYLTPTLIKPVHLSGTVSVTIRLSSNKPAANLSIWLASLPWKEGRNSKITDNIITRGWADPQNHRSITESEPLVPGRFYEMTFDLDATSITLPVVGGIDEFSKAVLQEPQ